MATGTFMTARQQFPDAQIDLLTSTPFMEMGRQMGIFTNIYRDDRSNFNLKDWYRVCKQIIADGQYDYILDCQRSSRTKIRYRFLVNLLSRKNPIWEIPSDKALLGQPCLPATLDFCRGEEKHFSLLPDRFVLLIPGCSASNAYKRWSKENYAAIAKRLGERHIHSVILGTTAEQEDVDYVARSSEHCVNFLNKASLHDLPRLCKRALCTIGNDTGPMHMSCIVGTSTIGLFDQRTAFAARQGEHIVNLSRAPISAITVDEVWQQLEQMLEKATHLEKG